MIYRLDARELVSKEEAHGYIKSAMHFPQYYGKNLDALYDCLCTLKNTVVWFTHTEEAKDTYFEHVQDTFEDAALANETFFVLDGEIQSHPLQLEPGENKERLIQVMQRAAAGEELTIGFLGGSITQGSLSSADEYMYAYRCFTWWKENFPEATFHYVNGGIGGTNSHFGVSRVHSDVLMYQPDVVVVDFSVNDVGDNDQTDEVLQEMYEGLMRRLLNAPSKPAVVALYNVFYDTGVTAQEMHRQINTHYGITGASMSASLYRQIQEKKITRLAISPDGLHPNDLGHELVAYELCRIFEMAKAEQKSEKTFESVSELSPITENAYEHAMRYTIVNATPTLAGFRADAQEKKGHLDCFCNGWIGKRVGDRISFTLTCGGLAIQYRKTIHKPSPVAKVMVEGDDGNQIEMILDGNFEQTWGDCLYLQRVLHHADKRERTITIEIIQATPEDLSPFYLLSLITD